MSKKIVIVSDAWLPQINGVVRTLQNTIMILRQQGHMVDVIHPAMFVNISMPGYHEINIALNSWKIGQMIELLSPDYLHISTEGPLGIAAKIWADNLGYQYTTAYHTRFPEYMDKRIGFGLKAGYCFMRWFHRNSKAVMVNTESMRKELQQRGLTNLVEWGRGVDHELYTPEGPVAEEYTNMQRPIFLNVGRVSVEKNLEHFYKSTLPGTKVQIGDGPMLETYRNKYPEVKFLGSREGSTLAEYYRGADVFVFPSITDTFGLVIVEALASGIPVAAYCAPGPLDIIETGITGYMDGDNIEIACLAYLALSKSYDITSIDRIRTASLKWSWISCTRQFEDNLVPLI